MTKIQDITYDVIATEKENGLVTMTVLNKDIKDVAPIIDKPLMISVQVHMMLPDVQGLPSPEEIQTIGNIENTIVDAFLKNDTTVLIGWVKAKGQVNFLFYTSDASQHESTLKIAMNNFPSYIYSSSVQEDAAWKAYFTMVNERVSVEL